MKGIQGCHSFEPVAFFEISFFFFFLPSYLCHRLGLIFVVDDSQDVDGIQDAGVAILRAYNYVAQETDDYHAFQTLIHVCFHHDGK